MLFQQAAAPGVNVGLCGDNIIYQYIAISQIKSQPASHYYLGRPIQTYDLLLC